MDSTRREGTALSRPRLGRCYEDGDVEAAPITRGGKSELSLTRDFETRTPNRIDLHVGARVRVRRKLLHISQEQLAATIKLTFQQVQKYERAANRISASRLYEIARALQVPISYFFDGLPDSASGERDEAAAAAERVVSEFLATPEGLELAEMFPKMPQGRVRRQVLDLVRAMAEDPATIGG